MRTLSLVVLAGLLSLPGFAPAPQHAETRDLNFEIFNQTGYTITAVYASWCATPGQQTANLLGQNVLYNAQSTYIALNPGCVNLRAIAQSGHHFYYGLVVDADGVYEWYVYSQ